MIITVFLRFPCSIRGDYVGCNFPGMLLLIGQIFPTHGACCEAADHRAYHSHGSVKMVLQVFSLMSLPLHEQVV